MTTSHLYGKTMLDVAPRAGSPLLPREPRVAIIADSLALPRQVRSPRDRGDVHFSETYPYQLARRLEADELLSRSELLVNGRRERLMRDVPVEIREALLNGARAIVVHVGICDCAPRVLSRTMHAVLARVRPGELQNWIIRQISRHRSHLVRSTSPTVYTSEARFRDEVRTACRLMVDAEVALGAFVNISPPDPEMEKRSPGYESNVRRYNTIIAEEVSAARLTVIDIAARIGSSARMKEVSVEGQHLNALGNGLIAEMIQQELRRAFLSQADR